MTKPNQPNPPPEPEAKRFSKQWIEEHYFRVIFLTAITFIGFTAGAARFFYIDRLTQENESLRRQVDQPATPATALEPRPYRIILRVENPAGALAPDAKVNPDFRAFISDYQGMKILDVPAGEAPRNAVTLRAQDGNLSGRVTFTLADDHSPSLTIHLNSTGAASQPLKLNSHLPVPIVQRDGGIEYGDTRRFLTRSGWLNSLSARPQTVDFDDSSLWGRRYPGAGGVVLKGIHFTGADKTNPDELVIAPGACGTRAMLTVTGVAIRMYLPQNTTAFACDMAATFTANIQQDVATDFTVKLSNGVEISEPGRHYPEVTFIGITSRSPIEWVEIRSGGSFLTIDNVSSGSASPF